MLLTNHSEMKFVVSSDRKNRLEGPYFMVYGASAGAIHALNVCHHHILAFCNENSFLLQNLSDFLGHLPIELLQKRSLLKFLLMADLLWPLVQETTVCPWYRSSWLRSTRSKPESVKIRSANQACDDIPQRLPLPSGSMQLRTTLSFSSVAPLLELCVLLG